MISLIKHWMKRRTIGIKMDFVSNDEKFKESRGMRFYREKFTKKQNEVMKIMFDMYASKIPDKEKAMLSVGMMTMLEQVNAQLNPVIKDYVNKHLDGSENSESCKEEKPNYIG